MLANLKEIEDVVENEDSEDKRDELDSKHRTENLNILEKEKIIVDGGNSIDRNDINIIDIRDIRYISKDI